MSGLAEEDTVDWGDVETATDAPTAGAGDDVISLGGAEELEEDVSPPKDVEETSNGKADEKPSAVAAIPAPAPAPPAVEKPLPPGWKLQQARSGGAYYFNTVTGKTTWDFPSEDAGKPASAATPAIEKLQGIQIKGAAKNAPSSEGDSLPTSKKRDAVSQSKEAAVAEEIPQKRRRSNTPEKKRETWSASPEPAKRAVEAPRQRDDRPRETNTKDDTLARTGWGRRPDIASESNMPRGLDDSRARRSDNEARETGYNSRQRPDDAAGRDRGYQRGQEAAPPTGRFVRPDGYQVDRNRPAYDDRRPSARGDTDRSNGRHREPSPVPRRREEYDRGSEREVKGNPREREREREPERREVPRDQYRDRPREHAEVRGERDRNGDRSRIDDDRRNTRGDEPRRASREVEAAPRDRYERSSSHQNQGYGYMDRGNGARPPRADPSGVSTATGYGPARGYGTRAYGPGSDFSAPPSPATPFSPGGQGYGPRGMPPHPPTGGARQVRPWIAPEEKAKKWWNKNTGERKPVNPDAAAEAEADEVRRSRGPSSKPSAEPAPVYRNDRERELAEREAAIARKERELGLK